MNDSNPQKRGRGRPKLNHPPAIPLPRPTSSSPEPASAQPPNPAAVAAVPVAHRTRLTADDELSLMRLCVDNQG